jgi:hypothetical protein
VTEGSDTRISGDEVDGRYQQEMAKRLTRGERHYRSLRDLDVDFDADPYS